MPLCSCCGREINRTTAATCVACEESLCKSCNRRRVKRAGKRQCDHCIKRNEVRSARCRERRNKLIKDPTLGRSLCTKCRKDKPSTEFRRLLTPAPDGNPYERSCLSCLNIPQPTAVAFLTAPTETNREALAAVSVEPNAESARQQGIASRQASGTSNGDTRESDDITDERRSLDSRSGSNAPYADFVAQLTKEIAQVVEHCPTWLHKSDPLMRHYHEYIRIYNHHEGGDGLYASMATFGKDLELTQPQETEAAQVLCASAQQLRTATDRAAGLPDIPCIYIPREEQARLPTVSDLVTELQAWTHAKLEYQPYSRDMSNEPYMSIPEVCNRLEQRGSTASLPTLLDAGTPPYNFLDISGSKLELHRRPVLLDDLNLRLLHRAVKRIDAHHQPGSRDLGKEHVKRRSTSELQHVDLESCLAFLLLGERGAASGYHMDVLDGTWVQVVTGFKLWFVPTRRVTELEANKFGKEGDAWTPPVDLFRAVLLRPGDMLIMRPGYFVPHFVLTGKDSLAMGGMEWTRDSVPSVLEQLRFIIPQYNSTNEPVPRQLTQVLDTLPSLVPEHANCVMEFAAELKNSNLLYCTCGRRCTSKCTCRKKESTHNGCTSWCHNAKGLRCCA